eukprot:TRINITY_DN17862_c0_g1_i1.p1 TRINITY_DN17862_c0_g1~~TRINITY_DN17862_c0_g1_i1.p1  ORF type:complete len:1056 (+),score=265.68 TRINITY_DN17862_c0_g1_i1:62-3229(+)
MGVKEEDDGSESEMLEAEEEDEVTSSEESSQEEKVETASSEREVVPDTGFRTKAAFAYRSTRVLCACSVCPLLVLAALVTTGVLRAGSTYNSVVDRNRCVHFARVVSNLSNELAAEGLLTVSERTELSHEPASLRTTRAAVDKLLHRVLRFDGGQECIAAGVSAPADILSAADLATARESMNTSAPSDIVKWYGDRVDRFAMTTVGALRHSLANVRPQRRTVGLVGVLHTRAAGMDTMLGVDVAVSLAARGAQLKDTGRGEVGAEPKWAQSSPSTGPATSLHEAAVRSVMSGREELEEGMRVVDVLLPERAASIREGFTASAGLRGQLDSMFQLSAAADVLPGAEQRRRLALDWLSNASRCNTDLDSMRTRLSSQLTDSAVDYDRHMSKKVGAAVLTLLLICVFVVLDVFMLWHFRKEAQEEVEIEVDFRSEPETLAMIKQYCNCMGAWLLEDIVPCPVTEAPRQVGQMELRLRLAVNALRHLRPFVPPWVFRNRAPLDMMEAAKYVEKPKYKQPSIDLTAEIARMAEAKAREGAEEKAAAPPAAAPPPPTHLAAATAAASGGGHSPRTPRLRLRAALARDDSADDDADSMVNCPQIVPDEEFDHEKNSADMNGLPRSLNLEHGLALHDDVSLVVISLKNMNSRENHSIGPDAVYRDPEAMAHSMNTFLKLVSEVAESYEGVICRITSESVFVGFNMTWTMEQPLLCAKNACVFAVDLIREYERAVVRCRSEEEGMHDQPLTVGTRVEMRARGTSTWRTGVVTQVSPVKVQDDEGGNPETYPFVRAAKPMCSLEQSIGSPETGWPMICIVTGNMFTGVVNTGTFRTFEFVGPQVQQLMKLQHLGEEYGIRVLVDSWTRELLLQAPVRVGDIVQVIGPAEKVEMMCRGSDKGLGWNEDMAKAAGAHCEVLATHTDDTIELQLDGTSARFPLRAVRHGLPVHQAGILHDEADPWDTRHVEIFSELLTSEPTPEMVAQQNSLDAVFACLRGRRYKAAERALTMYVNTFEVVECDVKQHTLSVSQSPQERPVKVNMTTMSAQLKDAIENLASAAASRGF